MEHKMAARRKGPSRSGRGKKNTGLGNLADGHTWNVYSGKMPFTPIPPKNHQMVITKCIDLGTILTSSVTVPVSVGLNFTLNAVPEVSSFTTLFDQYKIEEVECFIFPEGNTNNNGLDTVWASVLDYDDSASLTTLTQALDYDTVRVTEFNVGHYRRFKPRIAAAAYSGAFTSFANLSAPWIDCGSPSVQHYGIKILTEPSITAAGVRAIARLKLRFRASR